MNKKRKPIERMKCFTPRDLMRLKHQKKCKYKTDVKGLLPQFFKSKRLEIGRILVEELQNLDNTKAFTEEEFMRLVDRLAKVKK